MSKLFIDEASSRVQGFAPVSAPDARVLVLGTMPGAASLRQARYYANPRNAFWAIAAHVLGFDPDLDYPRRLAALCDAGVALWDVLAACERPGSLDSRIRAAQPNDFSAFFQAHPQIKRVCFNGAKAAELFRRHVGAMPGDDAREYLALPSTSPAHAAMRFEAKREAWRVLRI